MYRKPPAKGRGDDSGPSTTTDTSIAELAPKFTVSLPAQPGAGGFVEDGCVALHAQATARCSDAYFFGLEHRLKHPDGGLSAVRHVCLGTVHVEILALKAPANRFPLS